MTTEAELGVRQSQVKEGQQLPTLEEARNGFPLRASLALLTLAFSPVALTFGLQTSRTLTGSTVSSH